MKNSTSNISFNQLQGQAKRLGCEILLDSDSQCYRATAPNGKCFEPALHELIAVFGGGFIGNDQTKQEARKDLYERLADYVELETCEITDCDWCNDGNNSN